MSIWDTLKGVGSAAEGMAPYVAPIIERHRQRDLQAMQMQQQKDEQDKKDKLAQAMGQSTMDLNKARADAVRNPVPKTGAIKTIAAQDGTLYRIYPDGTYEAAPTHTTETPKIPGVADQTPSTPPTGVPGPQAPTPQQPVPPVATAGPAPKFGTRAPIPPPDPTKVHAANRQFDVDHPLPVKPENADRTLVQTVDPTTGAVVYTRRADAVGLNAPGKTGVGALAAPMAAKVGQFGEMLKKTADLMPATEALEMKLGSSAAQDVATHGIGAFGMHVPGTKGLGSMMLSKTPEAATYQAALTPFILAAAHALSGARINDTQVQQIRASVEITPGMAPAERAQKKKNLVDLINSIGGSLPPDAIGSQEGQMDQETLARLEGYGYKRSKAAAPGGRGGGAGTATAPQGPAKPIDLREPVSHVTPEERKALKAQGFTDAQIDAIKP